LADEFTAANPDFKAVVRESFSRQPMMASLGAQLSLVEPGHVHISLPRSTAFTQQNGFMHAGAIASVADSACGYAAFTLSPPGTDVLAVEFKINLVAPAVAEQFEARARVLRSGKTLSVCFAEVYGLDSGSATLVATMLSTIIARAIGVPGAAFSEGPPVK
jgi:uncharacterized protein (TIGR00369 family)